MMKRSMTAIAVAALALSVRAADTRPAPDYSSPDKTWATVCAALKAEDLTAFRACFSNSNELSRLFMASYSELTVTTFRLANVIDLIPGGKDLAPKLQAVYTDLVDSGKDRKTEYVGMGDREAKWSRTVQTPKGPREEVTYFKKVDDKWLIDTESSYALESPEGRKAAEDFIESSKKQIPMLQKVIDDIQANKIRSLEELRRRLTGSN
jgi:hypothetical protein